MIHHHSGFVKRVLSGTSSRRGQAKDSIHNPARAISVPNDAFWVARSFSHIRENDGFPVARSENTYSSLFRQRNHSQFGLGGTHATPPAGIGKAAQSEPDG